MTDIEWLKELVDERDRRYSMMDDANKAAVRAAFEAQEKITIENKSALDAYKASANEWRATVQDLIGNIRGQQTQRAGDIDMTKWIIGLIALVLGAVIAHFWK